jgi:hypothetical protein
MFLNSYRRRLRPAALIALERFLPATSPAASVAALADRESVSDHGKVIKHILGAVLWTAAATSAAGQGPPDWQRAVADYRVAVIAAESGKPNAIERAFDEVSTVRDTLLQGSGLQSLSDDAFEQLVRQLRGVIVNRREMQFVQPDLTYYVRLADMRGDAADKAFFAALKATYPNSVWPVYLQRQTDAGGCTRFGTLSLVNSYQVWSQFRQRFPTRYESAATAEVEGIFELLTDGDCACGTIAEVERELVEFNTRFPASPVRSEIEARLRDIRRGEAGIRASCRAE